ncbi:MAG: hypothetical protein ACFCBW_05390 [Candidatus Competibacterales bacterium]
MAKKTPQLHKPRNLAATSPLMRKGGSHQAPKAERRQRAKREMRRALDDALGRSFAPAA